MQLWDEKGNTNKLQNFKNSMMKTLHIRICALYERNELRKILQP